MTTSPSIRRHSWRRSVALHLAPGIPALVAYLGLAAIMSARGLPNLLALPIVVLFVEAPVTWAIVVREVRRERGGAFRFGHAFLWTAPVPKWIYVVVGLPTLVFSMAMIGGVGPVVEGRLVAGAFAWVPEWFVMRQDPAMFATLPRDVVLAMWALTFVGFVVVGGVTQELYFRGFLLPRIAHLGRGAPVLNAGLFATFHLIAPWSWPVFFLMTVPWAYLVWWRRSVKIGVFVHVAMLGLQWVLMTLVVFGVVRVPGT